MKIKLTESTDARNARMWSKFRKAADGFERHVALIEWQDNRHDGIEMSAWVEGVPGYQRRVAIGVPGYESLIRDHANAYQN